MTLIAWIMLVSGVRLGVLALRAEKRPSQASGAISVALVVFGVLMLIADQGSPPDLMIGLFFCVGAIPGTLAVIFNRRPPRRKHGHCKKCGYNLRGNVSGKCSECGLKIG